MNRPDAPPNFLGMRAERLGSRRVRVNKPWGRETRAERSDAWLEEAGFYDAVGDAPSLGMLAGLQGREWNELSEGRQRWGAAILRNLNSWWCGLNDAERERFRTDYCDHDQQDEEDHEWKDPRHEDAQLAIPPGMEKMRAKGWTPHPYQAKAVNFALKYAPRADSPHKPRSQPADIGPHVGL